LFGTSGKQECEDGQMESPGAPAEYPEAFSPTVRWRASGEEASSCHIHHDGEQGRLQTVGGGVMRIKMGMGMDRTDTDTSQMV